MNGEELDYSENIWEDAIETDNDCPKCGSILFSVLMGDKPDNMENYLACRNCGYEERE
jgi:transcription elongation factor Elf1